MNIDSLVQAFSVAVIPVLFAISLHEVAHGYVARYFGDSTAAKQGRLSLNPIRHIDLFGTILLPLMLVMIEFPPLGYAKPIPVVYDNLRNPKKHMAFVAAAGPAANFVMGLGWMAIWYVCTYLFPSAEFFIKMAEVGLTVNTAMCVFNLIPVPTLDGGTVLAGLLPEPLSSRFVSLERYGLAIFVCLILMVKFGLLTGFVVQGMTAVQGVYQTLLTPLIFLLR